MRSNSLVKIFDGVVVVVIGLAIVAVDCVNVDVSSSITKLLLLLFRIFNSGEFNKSLSDAWVNTKIPGVFAMVAICGDFVTVGVTVTVTDGAVCLYC